MNSTEQCHRPEEDGPFRLDGLAGQLVKIGLALSSTRDLGELLELVLLEARKMTGADAGSVYLLEGNVLRFETSHNQTLSERLGEDSVRALFKRFELPLDSQSIAGHVAISREILNIPDVYEIPSAAPYKFNSAWDKAHGYRTQSMLTAPMMDQSGKVVGVIQLINAMHRGQPVPFDYRFRPVLAAFAIDVAQPIASASPTHPSLAPRVHRQKTVDTESKFNCGKEPGHRKAECAKLGSKLDLEGLNGKRPAKN